MNTPTTTLRRTRDRWATSMNAATKAGRTSFRYVHSLVFIRKW